MPINTRAPVVVVRVADELISVPGVELSTTASPLVVTALIAPGHHGNRFNGQRCHYVCTG